MDASQIEAIEDEIEQFDRIIKAAERWGKGFRKDAQTHAKIIKLEAKLARQIRSLFREKSKDIERYIDWTAYFGQINAAVNIKTIVSGDFYDGLDSDFINITFNTFALAIATGAEAGESIYKIPLGIRSTDAIIQELTTKRIAALVGKRVDKDGRIVDNPKAEYRIFDKTRDDIAKSIQTSINLGEAREVMVDRLRVIIDNPARADKIAQTEAVNAYASGLLEFGKESGAVGKQVDDVEAVDQCREYAELGVMPIDYLYGGTDDGPAFHPGCRCTLRLVYQNEMENLKK